MLVRYARSLSGQHINTNEPRATTKKKIQKRNTRKNKKINAKRTVIFSSSSNFARTLRGFSSCTPRASRMITSNSLWCARLCSRIFLFFCERIGKKKCSNFLSFSLFPRLEREIKRESKRRKARRRRRAGSLSLSLFISLFYLSFKARAEPCFTLKF